MNIPAAIRYVLKMTIWDNLGFKLLAIFLGFSVWFFVSSERTVNKIMDVRVEIVNKPAYLEIANEYPKTVSVQVRAREDEQTILYKARVDLASSHKGENIILLTADNFDAPSSIEIVSIRPSTLAVVLEPLVTRSVPVSVRYTGKADPNFEVKSTRVIPEEVTLSGPLSQVNSVDEIVTQTVDISDARETVERDLNLIMENPFLDVRFENKVRAAVIIEEKRTVRLFRDIPIAVANLDSGYRTYQKTVRLSLSIAVTRSQLITPEDFEVYLDGDDCEATLQNQQVSLRFRVINPDVADAIRLEQMTPEKVRFRFTKLPEPAGIGQGDN